MPQPFKIVFADVTIDSPIDSVGVWKPGSLGAGGAEVNDIAIQTASKSLVVRFVTPRARRGFRRRAEI